MGGENKKFWIDSQTWICQPRIFQSFIGYPNSEGLSSLRSLLTSRGCCSSMHSKPPPQPQLHPENAQFIQGKDSYWAILFKCGLALQTKREESLVQLKLSISVVISKPINIIFQRSENIGMKWEGTKCCCLKHKYPLSSTVFSAVNF